MSLYNVDASLTPIFERNGFLNLTETYFPGHGVKPDGKRLFKASPKARRSIVLDYHTLKSDLLPHREHKISEQDLEAYILYFRLVSRLRSYNLQRGTRESRLAMMRDTLSRLKAGDTRIWWVNPESDNILQEVFASIVM
ncbi:hypothetical protein ACXYMU_09630 [Pontibacter sp. CAU 1760]